MTKIPNSLVIDKLVIGYYLEIEIWTLGFD